jgi:cephalosporin-C deacetylase
MPYFDLPLEQLRTYLPARTEEADFDRFWQDTLAEARQTPMQAHFEPAQTSLTVQDFFDVVYPGFAGQPSKGWLVLPRQRSGKLPCVKDMWK